MSIRLTFAGLLILTAFPSRFALAQQSSSQTGASMSDRDQAGLRGPVKTVLEERTFSLPDGHTASNTTTTEYAGDGRRLEDRLGNSDGSDWVTKYIYSSDGRLSKVASGTAGSAPNSETTYSYDDKGRLTTLQSSDGSHARYEYEETGRKKLIETFEAQTPRPNTAYGTHWEGTDLGFADYLGGTLTTFYNEQGVATGAEFHDLDGSLVGHILRKFDSEGRVISEEQISDGPAPFPLPDQMRSQLNAEQLKAVRMLVGTMQNRVYSYTYDGHGRVIERHRNDAVFGDEVTVTTYNDYGDKISERTTMIMNSEVGRQFSLTEAGAFIPFGDPKAQSPTTYETQYTYQYDAHGNWTEQTTAGRSHPDEPLASGSTIRRKLTYY